MKVTIDVRPIAAIIAISVLGSVSLAWWTGAPLSGSQTTGLVAVIAAAVYLVRSIAKGRRPK